MSFRGKLKEKIGSTVPLSRRQIISLVTLVFLLYILPLAIITLGYQTYQASRATQTPITPPIPNNNPQIITDSLPVGYLGKKYNATVKAIDNDLEDKLIMKISNLPPDLYQDSCRQSTKRRFLGKRVVTLSCKIAGKSRRTGTFLVNVFVEDNKGGSDQKTLKLTIVPRRGK